MENLGAKTKLAIKKRDKELKKSEREARAIHRKRAYEAERRSVEAWRDRAEREISDEVPELTERVARHFREYVSGERVIKEGTYFSADLTREAFKVLKKRLRAEYGLYAYPEPPGSDYHKYLTDYMYGDWAKYIRSFYVYPHNERLKCITRDILFNVEIAIALLMFASPLIYLVWAMSR